MRTLLALVLASVAMAAPLPVRKEPPLRTVKDELALPPLGMTGGPGLVFATGKLAPRYADAGTSDEGLRRSVRTAQVLIWATSSATPPRELMAEVMAAKRKMAATTAMQMTRILAPRNARMEKRVKEQLGVAGRKLARVEAMLVSALDDLNAQAMSKDNLRWQAHRSILIAALTLRIVHLGEYSLALGSMRKEFPPRDPATQTSWRLEPALPLRDSSSKKLMKTAEKGLRAVAEAHPNTVWSQAAEQLLRTPLGVTWKAQ